MPHRQVKQYGQFQCRPKAGFTVTRFKHDSRYPRGEVKNLLSTIFSLLSPPGGGAYSFQDLLRGAYWRWGAHLFIQKTSDGDYLFELHKLKIVTQYISYNNNIYINNITT